MNDGARISRMCLAQLAWCFLCATVYPVSRLAPGLHTPTPTGPEAARTAVDIFEESALGNVVERSRALSQHLCGVNRRFTG